MIRKYALLLTSTFLVSCGGKSTSVDTNSVQGPVITGSKNSGAYLTMVAGDLTVSSTSLYYYNFGTGALSLVSSAEGRDPVAIWQQSSKTIGYLVRSTKALRSFQLENGQPVEAKSATLTDLTVGDPTGWIEVGPSKTTHLIANLHEKGARTLEISSGYLSKPLDTSNLDLSGSGSQFSPLSCAGTNSTPWVIAGGVDFSGVNPATLGSGAAFKFEASGDTWTPSDLNLASAKIQGAVLTASNPTFSQLNQSGATFRVFGLCKVSFGASCKPGADEVNLASGAVTPLASFKNSGYEQYSWVVSGSTDDFIYAHVNHTVSNNKMVIRANLLTGDIKEIHTFSDETLSLLAYDRDADRLFIGAKDGSSGALHIYKSESLEATVATKEIPWNAAFVSSL